MKLKCLLVIALLLVCTAIFATDPWGSPVILTGSMTVMTQVSINGAPAATNDVLGAFVTVSGSPQLRGKATIQLINGIAGCLVQIYTETNGETISFKVWDESAQTAFDATQTLPSEINGTVGSYPNNLYQITAGQTMVTDPWPEPAILTGSMVLMAQVSIHGVPATNEDILAAFVSVGGQEQLRGKENISLSNGIAGCLLQIYTETNGETITFKVWDYGAQQIVAASSTLLSEVNGIVGSWPDDLFQIDAGGASTVLTPVLNPAAGTYQTTQNINITCATPGAQIRYTTNASDPTESSTLYSAPIPLPLNSTTTLKARAFLSGWNPSNVASAIYVITGTVAGPIMNPAGGTYPTAQNVSITCATPGSLIRYTTNGIEPTSTSTIYTAPVHIEATTTLKAKAYKTDWTPSPTTAAAYIITGTVLTPTFSPAAGTYQTAQNISITCATPGAQIRYTTNGNDPTESSAIYSVPILLPLNSTTTLKARAYLAGWTPSAVASASYVITGQVPGPTFDPPAGSYQQAIDVLISCSLAGSTIHYTLDGGTPTAQSPQYSDPIHLTQNTTIKAIAVKADWTASEVVTASYQVSVGNNDEVQTPVCTGIQSIYPNPFLSSTTIHMGIKGATQNYQLEIYNIKGEMVRQVSGTTRGFTDYCWNGCDASGTRLPSGIYLVLMKTATGTSSRKLVLK